MNSRDRVRKGRISVQKLARVVEVAGKIQKRARQERSGEVIETRETSLGVFEPLSMADRFDLNIGHTLRHAFEEISAAAGDEKPRRRPRR